MTKLLVLLSTWNGIRYLPAQLDSLLGSDVDGELSILIRDDGSTDGTADRVRRLGDPRIRLVEGANLGPRGSFFELLRLARSDDADFVALCDQDDVWRPDKMRRALAMIGGEEPALYASSLDLVDEHLRDIGTFQHPGNRSFTATLLTNFVTGCTCVMNRAFLDGMPFPENGDKVIMHDWWLASIATLGGRIAYDRRSFIRYRQHASNHVGVKTGIAALAAKLKKAMLQKPVVTRFDHARQLQLSADALLSDEQRTILSEFLKGELSWRRRLAFVLRHRADIGAQSALRFVILG